MAYRRRLRFGRRAFVVPVDRWCVVGWVVLFVVIGVAGRAGCLGLLPVEPLSMASHFELSSAVVSQVISLVRSLPSLPRDPHFLLSCRKKHSGTH